jgi:hypothetical protein
MPPPLLKKMCKIWKTHNFSLTTPKYCMIFETEIWKYSKPGKTEKKSNFISN